MNNYQIVIPSKDRQNIITTHAIAFLFKHNLFYDNQIFIFVNKKNYNSYKSLFTGFENVFIIIGRNGLNKQRNYIKDYFNENENLLILDDDLIDICSKTNIDNLDNKIKGIFEYMHLNKIYLASVNPTNNVYFCTDKMHIGLYLCVGCFYFEINKKDELLYLNNETDEKEDYLRTIQHYNRYGKVLRVQQLCIKHNYNSSDGGMSNQNRKINNIKAIKTITNKYNNLCVVKKTNVKNEIEFRHNHQLFKTLYISKKYDCDKGSFISHCNITLDKGRNYKIYDKDTKQLLAIILRNTINIPSNIEKLENINKKLNNNCGDISGKIDYNRLLAYSQQQLKDVNKLDYVNKQKTKININNFQVSNILCRNSIGYKKYRGKIQQNIVSKSKEHIIVEFKPFFKHISDLYETFVPIQYKCTNYYMDTIFNSIQLNTSVRSANHKDSKNIGFSAMVKYLSLNKNYEDVKDECMDLFFSDYDLRISLNQTDLIFFDSAKIAHSNPPIQLKDGTTHEYHNNSVIRSIVLFKSKSLLIK